MKLLTDNIRTGEKVWKNWPAVKARFPSLPRSTPKYWLEHPNIMLERKRGSGHPTALSLQQESELIKQVCISRRKGDPIGLSDISSLAQSLVPGFKASRPFVHRIMADYGLAGPFIAHYREAAWFPGDQDLDSGDSSDDFAEEVTRATEEVRHYLADYRAKAILLELRGLGKTTLIATDVKRAVDLATMSASARGADAADNVIVCDESRWKSATAVIKKK